MMTHSICPVCHKVIAGDVAVGDSVYMVKACPEHGMFVGMVERDPDWYMACKTEGAKEFYPGYLIDITDRCNIRCKYCYHANGAVDHPVNAIVSDAKENAHLGPIILTGGEPTLHPELPEIIRQITANGQYVFALTNGILLDDEYIDLLSEAGLRTNDNLNIALSFHKESAGGDFAFLERCRTRGFTISSSFFVIDNVRQIDEAIAVHREYGDVLQNMRIKAASNLWNEAGAGNKIYVSDMLRYFADKGPTNIITYLNNKVSYANIMHGGLMYMLVSWYDSYNVDLDDINCGPWYKAKDGTINNLVTTCFINEPYMNQKRLKAVK